MKRHGNAGLTLLELLLSIAVLGLVAAAAHALVTPALEARAHADRWAALHHEGAAVMDRLTEAVRLSTEVHLPSASDPVGTVLALSGLYADEDPADLFEFRVSTGTTLVENLPSAGTSTELSHRVTSFQVQRVSLETVLVAIELTGGDGVSVHIEERACARNVHQRAGKRVP